MINESSYKSIIKNKPKEAEKLFKSKCCTPESFDYFAFRYALMTRNKDLYNLCIEYSNISKKMKLVLFYLSFFLKKTIDLGFSTCDFTVCF